MIHSTSLGVFLFAYSAIDIIKRLPFCGLNMKLNKLVLNTVKLDNSADKMLMLQSTHPNVGIRCALHLTD